MAALVWVELKRLYLRVAGNCQAQVEVAVGPHAQKTALAEFNAPQTTFFFSERLKFEVDPGTPFPLSFKVSLKAGEAYKKAGLVSLPDQTVALLSQQQGEVTQTLTKCVDPKAHLVYFIRIQKPAPPRDLPRPPQPQNHHKTTVTPSALGNCTSLGDKFDSVDLSPTLQRAQTTRKEKGAFEKQNETCTVSFINLANDPQKEEMFQAEIEELNTRVTDLVRLNEELTQALATQKESADKDRVSWEREKTQAEDDRSSLKAQLDRAQEELEVAKLRLIELGNRRVDEETALKTQNENKALKRKIEDFEEELTKKDEIIEQLNTKVGHAQAQTEEEAARAEERVAAEVKKWTGFQNQFQEEIERQNNIIKAQKAELEAVLAERSQLQRDLQTAVDRLGQVGQEAAGEWERKLTTVLTEKEELGDKVRELKTELVFAKKELGILRQQSLPKGKKDRMLQRRSSLEASYLREPDQEDDRRSVQRDSLTAAKEKLLMQSVVAKSLVDQGSQTEVIEAPPIPKHSPQRELVPFQSFVQRKEVRQTSHQLTQTEEALIILPSPDSSPLSPPPPVKLEIDLQITQIGPFFSQSSRPAPPQPRISKLKTEQSMQGSLEELFSQASSIAAPLAEPVPEIISLPARPSQLTALTEDPRIGELESQYAKLIGKVRDCLETLDSLPIDVPLKVRIAASLTLWD